MAFTFQGRPVECQLKMTNVQDDQAPAKWQKVLKKCDNSSTRTVAEQSMSKQTPLGWISYGVCQEILTDNLKMRRRIAAKFVPRLLTNDQKQRRVNVCLELLVREKANEDPTFISRIITGDESWIYGYDSETKQQSSLWKSPQSPRAEKARQVRSSTKTMLIVFFHREFVPPTSKMTVNSDFYYGVLIRSRENVRRKRPELWRNHNWLLQHDNTPARTHVPENHRVFD
jgi:hypothetical protein